MFPGLWSREEEVHVSVTVCMCAEGERGREGGGEREGGVGFPLQPTGAQRTI